MVANHLIWLLLVLCISLLVGAIAVLWTKRPAHVPLYWGTALIFSGLGCSLYSHLGNPGLAPEQLNTLRDLFLIVSGVGANILAGAAMARQTKPERS